MQAPAAQTRNVSLIRRDDTFLGICQAVGEDFGFNPTWLRILFALPLMFFPVQVLGAYLGLGVIVLLSRLLAPRPKRASAAPAETEAEPQAAHADASNEDQLALPIAA